MVKGKVFGNGEDKGLEIILCLIALDGFENLYKNILGQALGFVVIENHFVDEVDDFIFIAVHQDIEMLDTPVANGSYDCVVS